MSDGETAHASCFISNNFKVRLLEADDRVLFCELFTDKTSMKLIGPPLSEEAAFTLFQSALRANLRQPSRDLFYSIRCKRTDAEVGLCTLQRIDWISGCAEVGLMLRPEHQRRGVGREILSRLVLSAFDGFGIERLYASYHPENLAAKCLFAARGFRAIAGMPFGVNSQVEKAVLTAREWRDSSSCPKGTM